MRNGEEGTKNISNKFKEKESDSTAKKKHKFENYWRAATTAATIEEVNNHIHNIFHHPACYATRTFF